MMVMDLEKFEYLDGNVLLSEKEIVERYLEMVIDDFREEGFFDHDIYDYLCKIVLKVMMKGDLDKWSDVINEFRK